MTNHYPFYIRTVTRHRLDLIPSHCCIIGLGAALANAFTQLRTQLRSSSELVVLLLGPDFSS